MAGEDDVRRFRAYRPCPGDAISTATSNQKGIPHALLVIASGGFYGPGRMCHAGTSGNDHHDLQPGDDNYDDVCVSGGGRALCTYQHQHDVCDSGTRLYGTVQHQHHLCDAGAGLHGAWQHHDGGSHAIADPTPAQTMATARWSRMRQGRLLWCNGSGREERPSPVRRDRPMR